MPGTDSTVAGVAIVTGGACGVGRDLVDALAGRGFAVVLVYPRDRRQADAVVEGVRTAGRAALAVRADVGDSLDVERVFDETNCAFGRVDIVVHAAPRAADVLFEHAERRLRWGGATLTVSGTDEVADALASIDRWHSATAR